MDVKQLETLLETLRSHGGDTASVEVKLAAGGLPDSIVSTLCAFANRPGGGTVILGVDERDDFAVRGVPHPAALSEALVNRARSALEPPVAVDVNALSNGVLIVEVHETPVSHKPCRVRATGAAYMRFGDGDYRISELEVEGFVVNRIQPQFDRDRVDGASLEDLDRELVADFCTTARGSSMVLARFRDDQELLVKTGVITDDGVPTVGGILTLGEYPQQWFPNFVIQAGASDADGRMTTPGNLRFTDTARFDGPIPLMIDLALEWTRRQLHNQVRELPDGSVKAEPDVPIVALRELIANAVVHRDLAPWAWSRATELRITPQRIVIANPGGLFGTTVDRLGLDQLTSARNLSVVRICQYVRLRDRTVIEAMASGIPRVITSLRDQGLPPAEFHDQGIRFTSIVHRSSGRKARTVDRDRPEPTAAERRLLDILVDGPQRSAELAKALGITPQAVRRTLASLQDSGRIERIGFVYHLTTDAPT